MAGVRASEHPVTAVRDAVECHDSSNTTISVERALLYSPDTQTKLVCHSEMLASCCYCSPYYLNLQGHTAFRQNNRQLDKQHQSLPRNTS